MALFPSFTIGSHSLITIVRSVDSVLVSINYLYTMQLPFPCLLKRVLPKCWRFSKSMLCVTPVAVLVFSSCISNEKLIYLKNLDADAAFVEDKMISYEIPEYRLQFNDIVSVDVKTTVPFINEAFDLSGGNGMTSNGSMLGQAGGDIYYMSGYKVDRSGEIEMPLIGKIRVSELTVEEAKDHIKEKVAGLVSEEVFVRVKLGGIRFSTFGEFRKPGRYTILSERMTIFEAISHAGDLNTIAKRNELLLIRQYPEGSKLHRVDLQNSDIISSPFYFIQNNDQLYAEPMKIREVGSSENATQSIALIASVLTTVILIFSLVRE